MVVIFNAEINDRLIGCNIDSGKKTYWIQQRETNFLITDSIK